MLSGYKTYVVCGLAILNYVAHWATGEATLAETVNAVLPYIVGVFMRGGIAKLGN